MNGFPEQIGPYTITRELGRGGMGVVYLARDTRLDRDVAIKALPVELAADPARLERFEREAKTVAQLQHPNVAGIYGVDEQDGNRYLVLEYVEGETLEARLRTAALSIDDALEIAAQIAAGVGAAHDAGVIHRDLKPGNIMLRADGSVKVLDFGLAKTVDAPQSSSGFNVTDSPTLSVPTTPVSPTIPGAILGTAPYMSPEQARGKHIDKRTDIWSFGVVLFECLTGISPFSGETATDSIGAILHKEPAFDSLPDETPPNVRYILRRCLERDRNKRLHSIDDARIEIERALHEPENATQEFAHGETEIPTSRAWPASFLVAFCVLALMSIVVGISNWMRPPKVEPTGPPSPIAFTIQMPPDVKLLLGDGDTEILAISNDGRKFAFLSDEGATAEVYVRDIDSHESQKVRGSAGAWGPAFSPDGNSMVFTVNDRIVCASIDGGPPQTVCEGVLPVARPIWTQRDLIIFSQNVEKIIAVSVAGGEQRVIAQTGATITNAPSDRKALGFLELAEVPGANAILASYWYGETTEDQSIAAVDLDSGELHHVVSNGVAPQIIGDDVIVFLRESTLMAAPIDAATLSITSEPVAVLQGVISSGWADEASYAVSRSGTLVYVPGERLGEGRKIVRVDLEGTVEELSEPAAFMGSMRISRDGSMLTVNTLDRTIGLWTFDLNRKRLTLIEPDGEAYTPIWSEDGTRVTYVHGFGKSEHVVVTNADGTGERTILFEVGEEKPIANPLLSGWLAGDQRMLVRDHKDGLYRVLLVDRAGETELIFETANDLDLPELSPDGKWMAFSIDETDIHEVYVRSIDNANTRVQVSFGGGWSPAWAPDMSRLYFASPNDMISFVDVTIDEAGVLSVSDQQELMSHKQFMAPGIWGRFEIGPEGNLYTIAPAEWERREPELRVIVNWGTEVRRKLGMLNE